MTETTPFDEVAALKVFEDVSAGKISGDAVKLAIYNLIGDRPVSQITNWVEALPSSAQEKAEFKRAVEIAVVEKEAEKKEEVAKHFENEAKAQDFVTALSAPNISSTQTLLITQQAMQLSDGTLAVMTSKEYIAQISDPENSVHASMLVLREAEVQLFDIGVIENKIPKTEKELETLTELAGVKRADCKNLSYKEVGERTEIIGKYCDTAKDKSKLEKFYLQTSDERIEPFRYKNFEDLNRDEKRIVFEVFKKENPRIEKSKTSDDAKLDDNFGQLAHAQFPELSVTLKSATISSTTFDGTFKDPVPVQANLSLASLEVSASPVGEDGVKLGDARVAKNDANIFAATLGAEQDAAALAAAAKPENSRS